MGDFERRPDTYEISKNSIARLERLHRVVLEAATRLPTSPLCNTESNSPQESIRSWPLVIYPEHTTVARSLVGFIEETLRHIAKYSAQINEPSSKNAETEDQKWSLGPIIYSLEQRPILRGSVELRKIEPIGADIPKTASLAFLIAISGLRDLLFRDIHGSWGYHYHYLDRRERRSDTLLTFDQRSVSADGPTLCWEKHAEGKGFKAKAAEWGKGKRESIYKACHPDVDRIGLTAFKRPKASAAEVWPT